MRVKTLRTLKVSVDSGNSKRIPKGIIYEDKDIPQIILDEIKRGNRHIQIMDWSGYDALIASDKKTNEKSSKSESKTIKKRTKK